MSLSSRGLLTKIYSSNATSSHRKKNKSIFNYNSLKKTQKIKKNIISEITKENKKEEDSKNTTKNINKDRIKNLLEDNKTNKFPIIPPINLSKIKNILDNDNKNSISKTKKEDILEKNAKLNYKIIESTSEDEQHPLRELKKGLKGLGWQSSRFSHYPQYIYVQFSQPVLVKKIELVLHETNIPSMIKFYSYIPKHKDDFILNYKQVNYDYIGFIKTDTNERTNFELRESRKIYINSKAIFFKLELDKNYFNNYNLFNQIGLLKLEFFGDYLPYLGGNNNNNTFILKHATKRSFTNDFDLEAICGQQLTELKKQMNYNIEIENYLLCKEIKKKIEKLRLYGKRIFELESEKNIAINNEDFSKAIEIKNLLDKMKMNLLNLDNIPSTNRLNESNVLLTDKDNQKFSNIPFDLNNIQGIPNSYEFSKINDSIISTINDEMNNNNYNNISNRNNNISFSNNSNSPGNNKGKLSEDFFGSYDETVLPTILKKLNNEETKEEDEIGEAEKGELEEISPKLLNDFILIANVLGKENMSKIFAKHILWKEEGLNIFLEQIDDILKKNNNSNDIISSILKLCIILLEEKHPSVLIKTLDIIKRLFEYIKKYNINLKINPKITDSILIKIKEKLGDVNPRVRAKAVSLYCYMLSLNFCDYNNLISELVEEEIKNNDKYIPKSSNLILGKLDIFINLFNNFDDSIKMKRTNKEEFPSALLMEYLICNISHNKPEIRKKTRQAIDLFLKIFGIPKFKKNLERIDERELLKLINEIPDLKDHFPDIVYTHKIGNINTSRIKENKYKTNKKKVSKLFFKKIRNSKKIFLKSKIINPIMNSSDNDEKDKEEKNTNNNINQSKETNISPINSERKKKDFCNYCKKKLKENEILSNHWISHCPMFTRCEKCNLNLEVQKLNYHRANECKFKNEFKLCNNCKEYLSDYEYDLHNKKQCYVKNGFIKCPLCHQNIYDSDIGFYQHLVLEGCPIQKSKNYE